MKKSVFIYDLNSAFEKADRLLEQKRTGDAYLGLDLTIHVHNISIHLVRQFP